MPTRKCPACGGADFDRNEYVTGLVAFPRTFANLFRLDIIAKCAICLACGHISHYVDDAALAKLRARNPAWKGQEADV